MRIGTQCDDMGLFIPLMVFKSEVIGMSHDEIKQLIDTRLAGMRKEAHEKCAFLQKDVSERIIDNRISEMAIAKCESSQSKTSSHSNESE